MVARRVSEGAAGTRSGINSSAPLLTRRAFRGALFQGTGDGSNYYDPRQCGKTFRERLLDQGNTTGSPCDLVSKKSATAPSSSVTIGKTTKVNVTAPRLSGTNSLPSLASTDARWPALSIPFEI
jgi:hypothetical protein